MWRRFECGEGGLNVEKFECGEGRFVYMWRFECGEGLSVEKGRFECGDLNVEV